MANVKARRSAKGTSRLQLDLFAPGMTALHKIGLAGLWMTLDRFNRDGIHLPGGSWEMTNRGVTLVWDGKPGRFFKGLFKESFRLNRNKLIWFPALGDPVENLQHATVLQDALLGTFLQHGKTRKADSSNNPTGSISVELGDITLPFRYRRINSYVHQNAFKSLIGRGGELRGSDLAGWHYPGGVVRHTGFGVDTALEEPPERLLSLIYCPVGAIYFQIRRRGSGVRPLYAIVVPEIDDLSLYAQARESFLQHGVADLTVSGTAEAGWRVLATLEARRLLGRLGAPACRVISFGTVPWSKQQKTRVNLFTVRVDDATRLRTFRACSQAFETTLVRPDKGEPFWDTPQTPELVARNLTEGRAWYAGFADFLVDKGVRDHVLRYEKGGLSKMVNEAGFDSAGEETFVRACHEAWRRVLGRLGERARREGASFPTLASREFERLRVGFSRCKNAASLREAITDFWARAGGPIPELASGWKQVLPLLDEKNWRKARDLALLALASYQAASREEAEILAVSET